LAELIAVRDYPSLNIFRGEVILDSIASIAESISAESEEDLIMQVLSFIAKTIEYPLDYRGRPTAARHIKVFKWWNGFYLADQNSEYGWLLPNQTIAIRKGICFGAFSFFVTVAGLFHS